MDQILAVKIARLPVTVPSPNVLGVQFIFARPPSAPLVPDKRGMSLYISTLHQEAA